MAEADWDRALEEIPDIRDPRIVVLRALEESDYFDESVVRIEEATGLSQPAIRDAFYDLKDAGVVYEHRKIGKSNMYALDGDYQV